MTEISDKYDLLSPALRAGLGRELQPERTSADGVGRSRIFEGGALYWHPSAGVHEVHGAIYVKWNALGRDRCPFLRYPHTDESPCPDGEGRFNHFYNPETPDSPGSIYWHPSIGAFEVHGAIRRQWAELGWETHHSVGYPITDETTCMDGVGRYSNFRNPRTGGGGSIYWHPDFGAQDVYGDIGRLWSTLGAERSPFGYPRAGERDSIQPGGRYNDFQHGSIYWHPSTDAYEVFEPESPVRLHPSAGGEWNRITPSEDVVGMHAAVIPNTNGSILLWGYDHHDAPPPGTDTPVYGASSVWAPAARRMFRTTYTGRDGGTRMHNIFCGGQAFMGDGRLLVIGGDRERSTHMRATHTYDPAGNHWTYITDTAEGRWYCTVACLPDGRMLAIGGEKREVRPNLPNDTYEIFDPATNRFAPPQPASVILSGASYPFVFVLPNHRLLVHGGQVTQLLNLETYGWEPSTWRSAMFRNYGLEGTAVLLPLIPDGSGSYRSRVLMIGGGTQPQNIRNLATETCELFDADSPGAGWRSVASMNRRRVMPDSVLLPDGKILVMNGSSTGFADAGANPVFAVEIYDPGRDSWTLVNSMSVPRLYHAVAALMPDGSVITAGTDANWNPGPFHRHEFSLEIYRPPYLYVSDRPVINDAPATLSYGGTFFIDVTASRAIVSVCLIRCSSVTHSFNSDQRYVGLRIRKIIEGPCVEPPGALPVVTGDPDRICISLNAPPDGFVAPPGVYMLFIRDKAGAISVAKFVRLR